MLLSSSIKVTHTYFLWLSQKLYTLEIPASRVFLGADAQLLGTSLASTKMPLSICLKSRYLNLIYVLTSQSIYVAKSKCWPLWLSSAIKAK